MAPLFRLVPRRDGLDLIIRGKPRPARWAKRVGLINDVVPSAKLDERVSDLARELASLAPGTLQMGLSAFRAQAEMDMDEALPFLKSRLDDCLQSEDVKEGISAFVQKRLPKWN